MWKSTSRFRPLCGHPSLEKIVHMTPPAIHLIQLMLFRLLSKSPPIPTVSDFKGFAEAVGTLVGLLPNSKVRAPALLKAIVYA